MINAPYDWLYANKLSLNINKPHYMVFSNTVNSLPGHILINNVTLRQIECIYTKFLGLYIDDDLSWNISYYFMQIALSKYRNFVQT